MKNLSSFLQSVSALWQRFVAEPGSSLRELDARALADIGIGAGEIASIDAEWRGTSALTRLRIATQPRHA